MFRFLCDSQKPIDESAVLIVIFVTYYMVWHYYYMRVFIGEHMCKHIIKYFTVWCVIHSNNVLYYYVLSDPWSATYSKYLVSTGTRLIKLIENCNHRIFNNSIYRCIPVDTCKQVELTLKKTLNSTT